MWVLKVIDDTGQEHELHGRLVRVVNSVITHGEAVNAAERGSIRVNWSDGKTRAVLETHYDEEEEPGSGNFEDRRRQAQRASVMTREHSREAQGQ